MPQTQEETTNRHGVELSSWWLYAPYGEQHAVFQVESWSYYGAPDGGLEVVPFFHWHPGVGRFQDVSDLFELYEKLGGLTVKEFWQLVDAGIIKRIDSSSGS